MLALEYEQRAELFGESALGEKKTIGIKKVSEIHTFGYLWKHPKLEVKYIFRINTIFAAVLAITGGYFRICLAKGFLKREGA